MVILSLVFNQLYCKKLQGQWIVKHASRARISDYGAREIRRSDKLWRRSKSYVTTLAHTIWTMGKLAEVTSGYFRTNGKAGRHRREGTGFSRAVSRH